MPMKAKKIPWYGIGIFSLIIVNFLIRLPFANDIAILDEGGYFQGAIRIYENHLNPFIEFDGYKPPVSVYISALFFTLFSPSRTIARLFIAFCSSLVLLLTYLLGRKLSHRNTGLAAAVLLFLYPAFFSQGFLYSDALPLAVLTLATIYSYLTKRYISYFVSATLLVMTKETAIFTLLALALYDIVVNKTLRTGRTGIKQLLFLLCPVSYLVLWMLVNWWHFGWFVWLPSFELLQAGIQTYGRTSILIENFSNTFLNVYAQPITWTLFTVFVLSTGIPALRKILFQSWIFFFLGFYLLSFLFLSFRFLTPRYLVHVTPLVFLVFGHTITETFGRNIRKIYIFVVLVCFWFIGWHTYTVLHTQWYDPDMDVSFFYYRAVHKQAIDGIYRDYPDAVINKAWPWDTYLLTPLAGYVKRPKPLLWLGDESELPEFLEQHRGSVPPVICIMPSWSKQPPCDEIDGFRFLKNVSVSNIISYPDTIKLYMLDTSSAL